MEYVFRILKSNAQELESSVNLPMEPVLKELHQYFFHSFRGYKRQMRFFLELRFEPPPPWEEQISHFSFSCLLVWIRYRAPIGVTNFSCEVAFFPSEVSIVRHAG